MTDTTPVGTYNPANLSTRDRIRSLLADTGPEFIIPDITIDSYIAEVDDWRLAAANAADQLASEYMKRVSSVSTGPNLSASWIDRSSNLRQLAARLRKEVASDQAANRPVTFLRSVELYREYDDDGSEYRDLRSEGYTP